MLIREDCIKQAVTIIQYLKDFLKESFVYSWLMSLSVWMQLKSKATRERPTFFFFKSASFFIYT